jgi:hypothetical protein
VDTGTSGGNDTNTSSGVDTNTSSGGDTNTSGAEDTSTSGTEDTGTSSGSDVNPPSCADAIQNGTETDIDCGGDCGPCALGGTCEELSDCAEGECIDGVCACPSGGCNPPPNCFDGSLVCDANATCIPSRVEMFCACNEGYTGDGITCTDTDECLSGLIDCGPNSTCENTDGGYTCACDAGFVPDSAGVCVDALDCDLGAAVCDANATCTAGSSGSFCVCNVGFAGDGGACSNIDECADATLNDCAADAACDDTEGAFSCTCNAGYEGDGTTCNDIDECTFTRCAANSTCVNFPGGFECRCDDGYARDATGACANIDECADGNALCDANATCIDNDGGYDCACDEDFAGDGFACSAASCAAHLALGVTVSGVQTIDPDGPGVGADPFEVLCDMTTAGGGWTSMVHGAGLGTVNYGVPFSEVALSSGVQFWVLAPQPNATYSVDTYGVFGDSTYNASAPTTAETGWLWNGVAWPNPSGCHAVQQLLLVAAPTDFPRSNGNPHYSPGYGMAPAVAAAALPTTDLMGAAVVGAYPSIHIGCVGWNVLMDPIVWVR